jgi:hypothetical protein
MRVLLGDRLQPAAVIATNKRQRIRIVRIIAEHDLKFAALEIDKTPRARRRTGFFTKKK